MKHLKQTRLRKIKLAVCAAAVLFCTIVGGYGIVTAPKSDQEELEQELKQNQRELEEEERNQRQQEAKKRQDQTQREPKQADATPGIQETPQKNSGQNNTGTPDATETPAEKINSQKTMSVIGDSVFLGAAPSFKKLYRHAVIDAKISRQVRHGLEAAKKMEKKNKLGDIVIISLGTNGTFNSATGQELIDYLGKQRTIYWIDAYGKGLDIQKEVNSTIHKLVKKNSNVHLIPWSEEGKKHPGWFYQDGTHLNLKGQKGFSRYIMKNLSLAESSP